MTGRLALFPLSTVLFPGLVLPLHVFEPRYRELMADLLDLPADEPRRFGVVAIREGREVGVDGVRALHAVGCTAHLREVHAHPDGRYDIVTVGTERFVVERLDTGRAYLQADVRWLDERPGPGADRLVEPARRLFLRYRETLLGRTEPAGAQPDLPDEPVLLSYVVAAATVLDVPAKQALLAAESAADRLAREVVVLRRETALLRRLRSLPAVDLARSAYAPN